MTHPICVGCGVRMTPIAVGAALLGTFGDPPEPYDIRSADLFQCPGCGVQIVAGIAYASYTSRQDDEFDWLWEQANNAPDTVYVFERAGDKQLHEKRLRASAPTPIGETE